MRVPFCELYRGFLYTPDTPQKNAEEKKFGGGGGGVDGSRRSVSDFFEQLSVFLFDPICDSYGPSHHEKGPRDPLATLAC